MDTKYYPGDKIMKWFFDNTNLTWTGFYLTPAPCQSNTSWMNKYDFLKNMGWGFAPIFVGQQPPGFNCTSNTLTEAKGMEDAQRTTDLTCAAGFPNQSVIYLDIEPGPSLSDEFMSYIIAWINKMISINRYLPGIYCSYQNADQIKNNSLAEIFWVWRLIELPCSDHSTITTFPNNSPSDSGVAFAKVWQMKQGCKINRQINVDGTIITVNIEIDIDTAVTNNPSNL